MFLVTNDDGSRNVTKILLGSAACAAGVAGVGYLTYQLTNYLTKDLASPNDPQNETAYGCGRIKVDADHKLKPAGTGDTGTLVGLV